MLYKQYEKLLHFFVFTCYDIVLNCSLSLCCLGSRYFRFVLRVLSKLGNRHTREYYKFVQLASLLFFIATYVHDEETRALKPVIWDA